MVRIQCYFRIAMLSALFMSVALADVPSHTVRLASQPTVHIKPCEPVLVILDVRAPASFDEKQIRSVCGSLRRSAVVIDTGTGVALHDRESYPVAVVFPNESSGTLDNDERVLQAVALFSWNVETEEHLFTTPGTYQIQFDEQVQVKIIVEEPTPDEQQIISELRELGEESATLFLGDAGNREKALTPVIERMLKQYPDTAYTGLLSIALGFQKLKEVKGGPGVDVRDYVRARERVARQYLEPYCRGKIKSLQQSAAALALADEILQRLRIEREMPEQQAEALRRDAIQLLKEVKDSPFALEGRSRAESSLRRLATQGSATKGS